MAFEYLTAWYLLVKDMDSFRKCMDAYFQRFAYPDIPVHYEEALLICQHLNPSENVLERYPVSDLTRKRFNDYVQAYKSAQSDRQIKNLYRQFGNTYWFYHHFRQPQLLKSADESNRY